MGDKKKSLTKLQIIVKLYRDGFIDDWVLWNLLGSRFKKHELELIDETFRKYRKRDKTNHRKLNE